MPWGKVASILVSGGEQARGPVRRHAIGSCLVCIWFKGTIGRHPWQNHSLAHKTMNIAVFDFSTHTNKAIQLLLFLLDSS